MGSSESLHSTRRTFSATRKLRPSLRTTLSRLNRRKRPMNRRDFLWQYGGGLGGIALTALLGDDGLLAQDRADGLHHPAKAKRVVQLFMSGAASQCDTFDYK